MGLKIVHDPEKWEPVFGIMHTQKVASGIVSR